ncbi:LPXTG cell wall anchor domain-containing protein [Limosilactobacillus oris]
MANQKQAALPKTGNDSSSWLAAGGLALSLLRLFGFGAKRKKNE